MRRILTLLTLFMLTGALAYAQERTVSGSVTDNSGTSLPGVSVQVTGTTIGATTNATGAYSINVPPTAKTLTISSVGFLSQTVAIPADGRLSVMLEPNPSSLEAVVVSALGLKSSVKSQGVAQTNIDAAQLTNSKPTNVASALSGKVAGLQISAISSGVNPDYRLVLRGMRSLLGNNQALVVVDNVIVPSSILGNLNPNDIDNVTVLNGGNAAALYGSDGSNGALIITTKRGSSDGKLDVTVSNTTSVESVSHMPKIQHKFGSGTDADVVAYNPYENQQYGPKFDGVVRPVGLPLEDGSIQELPYQWNDKANKDLFWQNGLTNQTDISLSSGGDRGSVFLSAQYLTAEGTVPGDKFNRASVRLNGSQKMASTLDLTYSAYYAQNRYDLTSETSSIFDYVLNAPGQIPLTNYSDWRTNKFANPNGYFNAYYNNPYFMADNYRTLTRNDYFVGNAALAFKPLSWFDATLRMGINTRNYTTDGQTDVFKYSDYTKNIPEQRGTYKTNDIVGRYASGFGYSTNLSSQLILHGQKKVNDFKFDLTAIGDISQGPGYNRQSSSNSASVDGLVRPGLFNLGNSTSTPVASSNQNKERKLGLLGKLDIAYSNYLFLTVTGRNDWVSTLAPENRSFFYPSAQIAFTPTDAIAALKDINNLDYFKVRGGWSQVGQVNLGAYSLEPIYSQSSGYPYAGQGGHSIGTRLVDPDLKPELTQGYEAGFDVSLFNSRVLGAFTYYSTTTTDQTLPTGISYATGFNSYLLNVGETSSKGIETSVTVIPIRTDKWYVKVAANYAYYDNKVDAISADIDRLTLSSYGGTTGSYAIAGEQFPVIMGLPYNRDPQGRIIVDSKTGYPSAKSNLAILGRANAKDEIGLNLEVTYKDLTLAATAVYRGGAYIYNALGTTFDFSGAGYNTAIYDRERFVMPNSSYEDPANPGKYIANTNVTVRDGGSGYWPQAGPRSNIDETYVTSSDFWKVREISLSYNLPRVWFTNRSIGIKGASLSVQGRNLLTFLPVTNVYTDPEYSSGGNNAIGLTDLSQTPPSMFIGGTLTLKF